VFSAKNKLKELHSVALRQLLFIIYLYWMPCQITNSMLAFLLKWTVVC